MLLPNELLSVLSLHSRSRAISVLSFFRRLLRLQSRCRQISALDEHFPGQNTSGPSSRDTPFSLLIQLESLREQANA